MSKEMVLEKTTEEAYCSWYFGKGIESTSWSGCTQDLGSGFQEHISWSQGAGEVVPSWKGGKPIWSVEFSHGKLREIVETKLNKVAGEKLDKEYNRELEKATKETIKIQVFYSISTSYLYTCMKSHKYLLVSYI